MKIRYQCRWDVSMINVNIYNVKMKKKLKPNRINLLYIALQNIKKKIKTFFIKIFVYIFNFINLD